MKRIGSYLGKMKGQGAAPARPPLRDVLWTCAGSSAGIGAVSAVSMLSKLPILIAPLGATCVLIFAVNDSPLAQPRSVIGGYLISALIGLLALTALGPAPWVAALALGAAIAVMQVTRTLHAPAGAVPLLAFTSGGDLGLLLPGVLAGALTLVGIGLLVNNLHRDRTYPRYWF